MTSVYFPNMLRSTIPQDNRFARCAKHVSRRKTKKYHLSKHSLNQSHWYMKRNDNQFNYHTFLKKNTCTFNIQKSKKKTYPNNYWPTVQLPQSLTRFFVSKCGTFPSIPLRYGLLIQKCSYYSVNLLKSFLSNLLFIQTSAICHDETIKIQNGSCKMAVTIC